MVRIVNNGGQIVFEGSNDEFSKFLEKHREEELQRENRRFVLIKKIVYYTFVLIVALILILTVKK